MSKQTMISPMAALVAVAIAFTTGIVGSLAVRPAGSGAGIVNESPDRGNAVRMRWRVPKSTASSMPIFGEMPAFVRDTVATVSNGEIELKMLEPGEVVPVFARRGAGVPRDPRSGGERLSARRCGSRPARLPAALVARSEDRVGA